MFETPVQVAASLDSPVHDDGDDELLPTDAALDGPLDESEAQVPSPRCD
jgi:hypothetical protein